MKKINKILCLAALSVASIGTLSGCNLFSKNLTDDQINKLMYILDNADSFMDESLSLLEKSNERINAQEAYNLVRLARANVFLNKDGIMNNVKINITTDNEEAGSYSNYKDEDGNIYSVMEADDGLVVVYEENGKVYRYIQVDNQLSSAGVEESQPEDDSVVDISGYKTELNYSSMEHYLADAVYDNITIPLDELEEIIGVTSLENGGYKVIATMEAPLGVAISESLVEFEITKDAKFNYINMDSMLIGENQQFRRQSIRIEYEYNGVDSARVLELVNIAKTAE